MILIRYKKVCILAKYAYNGMHKHTFLLVMLFWWVLIIATLLLMAVLLGLQQLWDPNAPPIDFEKPETWGFNFILSLVSFVIITIYVLIIRYFWFLEGGLKKRFK
jgi:uncharacterized BrkB/YihY/UPF0761 family membrane protein